MNLTLDIGNTLTKTGIFEGDTLRKTISFASFEEADLEKICSSYKIKQVIFSSVKEKTNELTDLLKKKSLVFIELTHETPLPIVNTYKTPHTLGKDRLAAVVGANFLQPNHDLLVIDAGTAITFDVITSAGVYWGGTISPGMDMRLKALHVFTEKLPLVAPQNEVSIRGEDTNSAIWNGVANGILFEIDGYITALKAIYPNLYVFLTGGSAFFFDKKLKNPIFAVENLVLTGLNRILNYNV